MKLSQDAKRKALEELQDAHGRITPEIVVKAASKKSHVLHGIKDFRWGDDAGAAHAWRIEVARQLIRTTLTVPVSDGPKICVGPAYVRDPNRDRDDQGYIHVSRVRTDADMVRDVLLMEFNRARAALQRAYDVAGVLNVKDEIPAIIERINSVREGVVARL